MDSFQVLTEKKKKSPEGEFYFPSFPLKHELFPYFSPFMRDITSKFEVIIYFAFCIFFAKEISKMD